MRSLSKAWSITTAVAGAAVVASVLLMTREPGVTPDLSAVKAALGAGNLGGAPVPRVELIAPDAADRTAQGVVSLDQSAPNVTLGPLLTYSKLKELQATAARNTVDWPDAGWERLLEEPLNPFAKREGSNAEVEVAVSYYSNGAVRSRVGYRNGRMHGEEHRFRPDGGLMIQGRWSGGEKHGTWTHFDEDGRVRLRGEYLRGMKHGPWFERRPSGVALEGRYEDGKRSGWWAYSDDWGELSILYCEGRAVVTH